MHSVFWAIFALMALYAAVARPAPDARSEGDPALQPPEPRVAWATWLLGAFAALGLIILLAGYVNGPQTMAHANTRWPIWNWSQGPFPGNPRTP